jgi:hypothetical protein
VPARSPAAGSLIESKPELNIRPDGGGQVIPKPCREGHGDKIVDRFCTCIDLVEDGCESIPPLRFKGQARNKGKPVFEPEHRSGVEQQVAGLAGPCLRYDRRGEFITEPEFFTVQNIHADRKTDRSGLLEIRRRFILLMVTMGKIKLR